MSRPLDGARLKVVRAQEHLDALKAEIRRYADTHPYEIVPEQREQIWQFEVRITTPPPLALSVIIGDCMANLRTALDYIVWQLALRYAARKLVIGKDRPYFPVYDDPVRCGDKLNGLARRYSIPPNAVSEIKAVQPYHPGYELLRLLHAAVNQNEHRLLLLTTGSVLDGELEIWPEGYPSPFRVRGRVAAFLETSVPTTGDAEPVLIHRDVTVKGQATIYVSLTDFVPPLDPVEVVLAQMIRCVSGIIPRFDPLI